MRLKSESDLKNLFLDYSKLRNKGLEDESLEIKSYVTDLTLRDARMKYRLRSSTLPLKMNMKSEPAFAAVSWRCNSCFSSGTRGESMMCPETDTHVLWCPAYAPLREGLSLSRDSDVIQYFRSVLKIREEMSSDGS